MQQFLYPTLQSYIEDHRHLLPVALDIARHQRITPLRDTDGTLGIFVNLEGADAVTKGIIDMARLRGRDHHNGEAAVLNTMRQMSELLATGPKVFAPTADECQALSEIEISLPAKDYRQPFPVFCVEFPLEWSKRREVQAVSPYDGSTYRYRPTSVIVSHLSDISSIFLSVIPSAGLVDNYFLLGRFPDKPIEEDLYVSNEYNPLWKCNDDERKMTLESAHLALNACLVLMANGFRKMVDPERDRLRARLLTRAERVQRQNPERGEASRQEARLVPELFTFVQSVNVRAAVGDTSVYQPSGRTVRPHWRRAHFRSQPHGPGNTLRKIILIPHTMIHRSQFKGSEGDTQWRGS
jgi:hypothetical protein